MKRIGMAMLVAAAPSMVLLGCPFSPIYHGFEGSGGAPVTTTSGTTSTSSTSSMVSTGGKGGSGGGPECQHDKECEDENPCTKDTCAEGQCVHVVDDNIVPMPEDARHTYACAGGEVAPKNKPVGTSCGPAPLACDDKGMCVGCTDSSQCPVEECRTYICDPNHACAAQPKSTGTPVDKGSPGDCKVRQCDGLGSVEIVAGDDPPSDDGNPCTAEVCNGAVAVHPNYATGKPCPGNNGPKFCDGAGTCVECVDNAQCTMGSKPSCDIGTNTCISCSDGIQNGGETEVDCGGMCPKKCPGATCGADQECASGHCADGVCCNSGCGNSSTCKACNVPGHVGTCFNVATSKTDPGTCASGNSVCTNSGTCGTTTKGKYGEACTSASDCYINACTSGYCRLANNAPCTEDGECGSLLCKNTVCTSCAVASDCATNVCTNGVCGLPAGAACTASTNCASGNCADVAKFCDSIGLSCANDSDCGVRSCQMGTCAPCAVDTDCASHKCSMGFGICLLPLGAPCNVAGSCISNQCEGFPPKCQ